MPARPIDAPHKAGKEAAPSALPWAPVFALLAVTMSDGIISCSLYPFLPFMVGDFGLPLSDVGYYAGLLGSAYNFSQFLSNVQWGRLSDVWGRRPVLVLGVASQAVTMVLFGLSSSLRQALVWRCLGGLLNGNAAVSRAVMRDLTDESNRTRGFSLLGTAYGMGFVVGPTLGGMLSRPADALPRLLAGGVLERFPYLLPCAASTLGCYPALLCLWWSGQALAGAARRERPSTDVEAAVDSAVELARPPGQHGAPELARPPSQHGAPELAPAAAPELTGPADAADAPRARRGSALRSLAELARRACGLACGRGGCGCGSLFRVGQLRSSMGRVAWLTVYVQVLLHFGVNAMQELFPLFCADSAHGLGLSPAQLGSSLAPLGLSLLAWPLLLSVADKRFGTVALFRGGVCVFMLVQAAIPGLKLLQRISDEILWAGLIAVSLARGVAGVTAFTAISVIMNNSITGDAGLVNGFAGSVTALSRAFAPTLMGSVFALCARLELPFPLDIHLPFYLLSLLSIATLVLSLQFRSADADGPAKRRRDLSAAAAEPGVSLLAAHGLKSSSISGEVASWTESVNGATVAPAASAAGRPQ